MWLRPSPARSRARKLQCLHRKSKTQAGPHRYLVYNWVMRGACIITPDQTRGENIYYLTRARVARASDPRWTGPNAKMKTREKILNHRNKMSAILDLAVEFWIQVPRSNNSYFNSISYGHRHGIIIIKSSPKRFRDSFDFEACAACLPSWLTCNCNTGQEHI